MIGCTSTFLAAVAACTYDSVAGCMRDASGAAKFPHAKSTLTRGWSQEWELAASGLSCSLDTFTKLHGATAVTSPAYLNGCFISVAGATYQLIVSAGAALDGTPPPPPPP
jgi:hypothetical protein